MGNRGHGHLIGCCYAGPIIMVHPARPLAVPLLPLRRQLLQVCWRHL